MKRKITFMTEAKASITITNRIGIHARPARLLVQTAASFQSKIQLQCDNKAANAKSIVGVLKLGAVQGTTLIIHAEGEDAQEAISALIGLVERKFDEEG